MKAIEWSIDDKFVTIACYNATATTAALSGILLVIPNKIDKPSRSSATGQDDDIEEEEVTVEKFQVFPPLIRIGSLIRWLFLLVLP